MMKYSLKLCITVIFVGALAAQVFAAPPLRPPAEAIDACEGKIDGAVCGFTTAEGDKISGLCRVPPLDAPADAMMACVPDGGRPPEGAPPGNQ